MSVLLKINKHRVKTLLACIAPPTKPQHEVHSGLFLDVVVCERAALLELLASKNESLLVRRNPLLVLNLAFQHIDCVRRLHLQSDCLARERLYKNLHASSRLNTVARIPLGVAGAHCIRRSAVQVVLKSLTTRRHLYTCALQTYKRVEEYAAASQSVLD